MIATIENKYNLPGEEDYAGEEFYDEPKKSINLKIEQKVSPQKYKMI
jgi:hypothetical protein